MKTLGVRQIRASYNVLVDTLAAEGEVILTHHGKPFARVLPLAEPENTTKPKVRSMTKFLAEQTMQTVPSEVIVGMDREERC